LFNDTGSGADLVIASKVMVVSKDLEKMQNVRLWS